MQLPDVPSTGEAYRVLVVEDDPAIAKLLVANIKKFGFTAHFAYDGAVGWQTFREIEPHLVISDIAMPNMSGHELTAKIRTVSMIPIILMTAMDSEDWQMQAFKNGADDYVAKPFNPQLLMARIVANLRRVYRYTAPATALQNTPTELTSSDWPKCESCGYMAPHFKFENRDRRGERVLKCPHCNSHNLVFSVK